MTQTSSSRKFVVYLMAVVLLALVYWPQMATGAMQRPRVRKEWRSLTPALRQKVARAFWTLKTTPTNQGRQLYGPNFNNHDEMLLLHACAVYDPRCDTGHFGPQFMTFHRAFLLKYERALLAVDPSIGAMPYWNLVFDSTNGKYRKNKDKYIFSSSFFGQLWTNATEGYAVKDGLFANWPITEYSSQRFGKDSWMAAENRCVREEWFKPTKCSDSSNSKTYLRDHSDCTPYVARNPLNNQLNREGKLGKSSEIVFTQSDFNACANPAYIKGWMDWQNCIEFATSSCIPRASRSITKHAAALLDSGIQKLAAGDKYKEASWAGVESGARSGLQLNITCQGGNLMGSYVQRGKGVKLVNFFHSQAHLKVGLDLEDVTTSPNDAASFTGHHANIDRQNMIWQRRTARNLQNAYWRYPNGPNDASAVGQSPVTISGPYSSYDLGVCAGDNKTFSEYQPFGSMWISGSWLDEVVNAGFAFKNLFDCSRDEVDSTGHVIRCNGTNSGYTHREILYWTAPQRSPYIYDNMAN